MTKASVQIALASGIALLAGSAGAIEAELTNGFAHLIDAKKNPVGMAVLNKVPEGVKLHLDVTGLPPGNHGLTLHVGARCDPPFVSSGKVFDPDEGAAKSPMGLLPDLIVGKDGKGSIDVTIPGANLNPGFTQGATTDPGKGTLIAQPGTSLVIHEKPGNPLEKTGRIACGIVEDG